jgi:hypothetical protein
MLWGNWQLVVDQHPPVLRNTDYPQDIVLVDDINTLFFLILQTRSEELAGQNANTVQLIDAINAIISHSHTLDCGYSEGAYAYAASLATAPTAAEIKRRQQADEVAARNKEFIRLARERAIASRHPDRGSKDNYG